MSFTGRPSTDNALRGVQDDLTCLSLKREMAAEALEAGYLSEPELCGQTGRTSSDGPGEDARPCCPHLPGPVLEIIAAYVLDNIGKTCGVLALLPMCGVCQHWRRAACQLRTETHLHFDGSKQMNNSGSKNEQRYRKLAPSSRGAMMLSAAGLFQGYQHVTLSGDAITDRIVCRVAQSAPLLRSATLTNCTAVTDLGVGALALQCPLLSHLALTNLSPDTTGACIRPALELAHLTHLELNSQLLDLCDHRTVRPVDMREWAQAPRVQTLKLLTSGIHTSLTPDSRLLSHTPNLTHLELEASPYTAANLSSASRLCPRLTELHIMVDSSELLDALLPVLATMHALKVLDVIVDRFVLLPEQLHHIGTLRLEDLRLVSQVYYKQPSLARLSCSHLDNCGIKALVDAVCERQFQMRDLSPLKLSICGASSISHDAVSALLRLPVLVRLNINGCNKVSAMDKMRLIAKVKAGREQNLSYNPMLSSMSPAARALGFH